MRKNVFKGLLGILGIWLTAGLFLPLVNVLNAYSPSQLMIIRGSVTALLTGLFIGRKALLKVDKWTILSGINFALASLTLFEGIRSWGANPLAIITTAAPALNLLIAKLRGKTVSFAALASLGLMFIGISVALTPSHSTAFNWIGLTWGVAATVFSSLFYEAVSRSRSSYSVRSFWQALPIAVVGILVSGHGAIAFRAPNNTTWILLTAFALLSGLLNFLAEYTAFDNLPVEIASILAQGYTPTVIICSWILLGEHLSITQWLGVSIAISSAAYLSNWLSRTFSKNPQ